MPQHPYVDLSLLTMLFLACIYDLAQRRIPNRLLAAGLSAALVLHLVLFPAVALLSGFLAGAAVGLIMFLPLYIARTMAAGDVKLMAAVGAFTGPGLAFEIGLAAYAAGGLMALLIVLANGQARAAAANLAAILKPLLLRLAGVPLVPGGAHHATVGGMPYALAITAGTLMMLWIRHT